MDIREFYGSLSAAARTGLLAGITVVLVLTGVVLWWVLGSRDQLLFGNLREPDAAEIVEALNEWKVPHEIIEGGTAITVPAEQVYDVRMRLVSAGVPKGGHVGFELFNDADFGITEFAQRVNFQRALQGELERTISSLPGVETARVHLTIRRPGLFVGDAESSKASVALSLLPGQELSRRQVSGIRSLVAAAVEGLPVEQVSVLDSSGALLAGSNSRTASVDEHADEEAQLEARLQARVTELLSRIVADGAFHVSVDARLNFDEVRRVSERPLAQGPGDEAVLVRRRVNTQDSPTGTGRSQNQEEAEFAHGTAREEVSRAPGRIERLSVAVVLPITIDEFEADRIRSLVSASVGIDEARGDRLEVSRLVPGTTAGNDEPRTAVPASRAPMTTPSQPAWPWWRLAMLVALGLLAGVILMTATIRRPRRLSATEREAVVAKLRGWLAEERLPS
jgi:flagellar M-ring protein FliF